MPEGPEVRATVDGICRYLGRLGPVFLKAVEIPLAKPEKLQGLPRLIGKSLKSITSHGKLIIFHFDDLYLLSTLGMTGGWFTELKPHCRFSLRFATIDDSEISLYYCDVRFFGGARVVDRSNLLLKLSSLGVDPLTTELTVNNFSSMRKSRQAIASLLLNQGAIVGVGNYLKSDILWLSRIDPRRPGNSITDLEWTRINYFTMERLRASYLLGGFTMSDYYHPDGSRGGYHPVIYGRSVTDEGYPVTKITVRGRATYLVEVMQE